MTDRTAIFPDKFPVFHTHNHGIDGGMLNGRKYGQSVVEPAHVSALAVSRFWRDRGYYYSTSFFCVAGFKSTRRP